jgi:hypothetical protein
MSAGSGRISLFRASSGTFRKSTTGCIARKRFIKSGSSLGVVTGAGSRVM